MAERKAVGREMAKRYRRANKKAKGTMIGELAVLAGWSKRSARRALGRGDVPSGPKKTREPVRIYYAEVIEALNKIWKLMGGPCGKRMAPFIEEFIVCLERHDEISLDPLVRARLCQMSAATIDRVLAPERKRLRVRGRHGTKPGTLLRNQIPIRTFADWDDARPGFCEVDLVGHDGGSVAGEHAQTLNLTDVSSGWTSMAAAANKAQRHVHAALEQIVEGLPFALLGLDSDNGGEFINDHLWTWCEANKITFTRTRTYRKNDNCFVEQKNWTHVRQQVGYARYDTPAELACLNELYVVLRLWVNFFNPQQKLVHKTRNGAKVTRRYDTATTPYQRLMSSQHIDAKTKRALKRQYEELNPAELSREIGRLQKKLLRLTAAKAKRRASAGANGKRPYVPGPDHPWRRTVNTAARRRRKAAAAR
jgi:hypothetical protein